ncbi:hypothetical protein PBI_KEPLER_56 [Arthrobacter phage Kepler]|uniref:Uncharacterized protein n=2 Tax=Coralvirus TaxID=2733171 RepID=A0A3G2KH66_9CAUD|nr:hypothetical protein HOU55_gp56 [Arthrobacter phage Kepler]AYN58301.1 hypothetical protein PBI_KEPLER_56 [Arthrobacter phage Kepler]AYN58622.1 hypothetical protein PBI_MELONS_56 [Arthrobacter phage Melons]
MSLGRSGPFSWSGPSTFRRHSAIIRVSARKN